MIAVEVATILECVPEFADRFLDLVEAADGDPGAPAVFVELADFVVTLDSRRPERAGLVARCLACVERVARCSDQALELVGWSFLDGLCPEDLERLHPWLGPSTLALAAQIEEG
ncbi:MAG TPA: hypothetical protein VMR97_04120 [Acidimicrobiales bacterium]|nr:hypothetical protein [Acidimicrobiales bacterium]